MWKMDYLSKYSDLESEIEVFSKMASSWPLNVPATLEDTCLNFCVEHLENFIISENQELALIPNIILPADLCDKFFHVLYEKFQPKTTWMSIFNDPCRSQLSHVILRHCQVTCKQLSYICNHPVTELDLSYCKIQKEFIECINKVSKTLKTLKFEGSRSRLLESIEETIEETQSGDDCLDNEVVFGKEYIFNCPNLRVLSIRDVLFQESSYGHDILGSMLCPLKKLTLLDLSRCSIELQYMDCLEELKSLMSLNLHGVIISDLQEALRNICKVKTLRHLDLSQEVDENTPNPHYEEPNVRLRYIVDNLPHLTSLDISGTDLAGLDLPEVSHKPEPLKTHQGEGDQPKCGIKGLEGRYFDFLGLLDCSDAACKREGIPAKKITGDADEDQILLSLQKYVDRRSLLASGLTNLFQLFRYSIVRDHLAALEAVLLGMKTNFEDKHIQISGSASLFYIVKGAHKENITQNQKRRIVECLLKAMELHRSEQTMMRNGCLTFCHLDIPKDVLFCYKKLVNVLIFVLKSDHQEEFMQRISLYLLNCLACQVDGDEKQTVGDLGAVEVMLEIILKKLQMGNCDEILEVAWSTLWNVTDETAKNCMRFMDGKGLELFLKCLKRFPEKAELLRNMMGLMGNIAEVKDLRPKLMMPDYISVFSDLLDSKSDGIEVSYNSAGMLAHIISDGEEQWTISYPSREEVMERMIQAIRRWPLDSKRNINYRSFLPILSLVKSSDTPAAQFWAVWALCNLTKVYPEKYCSLLKSEDGVKILQMVIASKSTMSEVKELASRVLNLIVRYKGQDLDDEDMLDDGAVGYNKDNVDGDIMHVEDDISSDEN